MDEKSRVLWQALANWGIARGIERHNFLILSITRKHIESLDYKGVVVDLGCGKAPYKNVILQSADKYIGVDWQNSMHGQSKVDISADLTKRLPFHEAYVDTVVSFNVLEHLSEPDTFFSECERITKSNGTLHMVVPFLWHVHEEPYDFYRFTRHGLQYLLEKHGFYEITIKPMVGFWQTWWLAFNYHTVRHERGAI